MTEMGLGCVRTLAGMYGVGQEAGNTTMRLPPQARIAAISGPAPRMFMTRVKL
jgi:hypothetical protein